MSFARTLGVVEGDAVTADLGKRRCSIDGMMRSSSSATMNSSGAAEGSGAIWQRTLPSTLRHL